MSFPQPETPIRGRNHGFIRAQLGQDQNFLSSLTENLWKNGQKWLPEPFVESDPLQVFVMRMIFAAKHFVLQ